MITKEELENKAYKNRNRIAELAERYKGEALSSIHHYLDMNVLMWSYLELDPKKSAGVDGVTKEEYGKNLTENLTELLNQVKGCTYIAPPVRRVEIPKGNGETRPLGIKSFEDKVLEKAITFLIEPIFEREFLGISYGFRPGKSPHDALRALDKGLSWEGKWVIDLDIRKFFDRIPHDKLMESFSKRIGDGVLKYIVTGWLKAGTMKGKSYEKSTQGTPQGGIISPLLANLYLHDALDTWFEEVVKERMKGTCGMVRYADDAILYFEEERDAKRVMKVLGKRLGKYGLELHPEKTKLLDYRRPQSLKRGSRGPSFDFLGFTNYWGRSRFGYTVKKVKTSSKKMQMKLNEMYSWLKKMRHEPRWKQKEKLRMKLRGILNYQAVSGNMKSLYAFLNQTVRMWYKWLNRRGGARMSWARFKEYLEKEPLIPEGLKIKHALY